MFRMLRLKPPNGWHAVAWELAIVTVGVLMALALQQWVEGLASKARADEAREAIRQQLHEHFLNAVEWRVLSPCAAAQINQLESRIVGSTVRLRPIPIHHIDGKVRAAVVAPRRIYDDSAWTGMIAAGTAFQLTELERKSLTYSYWLANYMGRLGVEIVEADRRLLAATRPIELNPEVKQSLIQSIDEIRAANESMDRTAAEIIFWAQKYGASASIAEVEHDLPLSIIKFCRAERLPMRKVTKAIDPNQ
jgi:hypothetical protein